MVIGDRDLDRGKKILIAVDYQKIADYSCLARDVKAVVPRDFRNKLMNIKYEI